MIIVKDKKALVFKLQDPTRITAFIPSAKLVTFRGHQLVAVPHRTDEVKVLRNLGFATPAPIGFYYEWSGDYQPFDAQKVTAEFLSMQHRAFCLNDMGTGKTLATLWAYDYLRGTGKVKKMLVVCPLSTMESTWADEVFRHFPHLSCAVLHGTRDRRQKLLKADHDIYLVNHDGLEVIAKDLALRKDINLVVLDEISQAARNAQTRRWKTLNSVINDPTSPRMCWGLTGTPTPNAPTDAWAQCKLLVPERVPKYANRFRDDTMRQLTQFKWVPKPDAHKVVHEAMQPSIRFSRSDCVDLPPCTYQYRDIELTAEQAKAYKEMLSTMRASSATGAEVVAVNEAVKVQKLLQIVCGVAYDKNGGEAAYPALSRLEETLEIIQGANGKTLVFVPFVAAAEAVHKYLTDQGVNAALIHGEISKNRRTEIFREFQNGSNLQVIVAQPAAMSHGLTLTEADTVCWFAPIYSNDTFEQACARVTRPGQKRNQLIAMLGATPLEKKIYGRLKDKKQMQGLLLDAVRNGE